MEIQDQEIIRQVLQGKQEAYGLLVSRYQQYVFTLVLRYIPGREEAEEVAQDVFLKAYRSLADFRGQSKFSTWLYTIVNTSCISVLRKKKDETMYVEEEKMQLLGERFASAERASDYSESKSRKLMMEKALAQLTEVDAQIISLFYQQEQTLEETGKILGLTSNHVKVRLFRARQKLKNILQEQYGSEPAHL